MADLIAASAMLDKHLRTEEGERLKPYRCSAGVPTIGVGATTYLDGRAVSMSDPPITKEQMDRMLSVEIDRYTHAVLEMVDQDATTNQLIGLVILAYNIGLPGLRGSTVIRLHRAHDNTGAARAFWLWDKCKDPKTGKLVVNEALAARRLREAAIYCTPDADDEAPAARMPQAVVGESNLAASPINAGGAAAGGAGVLTLYAQYGDQATGMLGTLRTAAETLGVQLPVVLGVVLAVAGCTVIYWRIKQRRAGWV